ncbi:MAG: pyridoxal phosphate-dependent aminotransferase [Clostridia bacterium]|nr:pyridoxal phosphate-dependent aminotransferase [Clostridia bacterium]
MEINEKMLALGSKRSIIREIFEYSKIRAQEVGSDRVYDFSLGNPSVEPPKEVAETIKNLLETESSISLHGYTSAQGDFSVRKAISDDINDKFKVGITPDNIYMTCGAAASLTISLKAILNQGEECIVFAPFFTEYRVFIENAGGTIVVSSPEKNTLQIDIKDFKSKLNENTRAVIINSPNNPSGVVYSEETVKKVCDLLRKKSLEYGKTIYLIADEPYRALVYGDVKVPYLMNYYDNCLVCYSYSKALSLPGERIGYIAVSPKMKCADKVYLAVCGAGRSLGYVCAPSLFQKVIKYCVNLTSDVSVYKENRDLLYNSLVSYGFDVVKPDGAFYLFVKAPEGDATIFYERAKKYDVLVVPCDDFGVKGYVRIAYCVDKKRIENSLPYFKKLAEEKF